MDDVETKNVNKNHLLGGLLLLLPAYCWFWCCPYCCTPDVAAAVIDAVLQLLL